MFNQQKFNQNDFGASLGNNPDEQQKALYLAQQQQQQQMFNGQQQMAMGGMDPMAQQQFNGQMMAPQGNMYGQQNQMMGNQQMGMMNGMQMQPGMMMGQPVGVPQQQMGFPQQQMAMGGMMGGVPQQQMDMGQSAMMGAQEPAQTAQAAAPVNAAAAGFDATKITKGGFNQNVSEFIPKGKVVKTAEQFPDLDALMDEAPKKKGKKNKKGAAPAKVVVAEEPEQFDETTAWKGRASTFFVMNNTATPSADGSNPNNFELNDEQWNFVFKYYPEYAASPFDMLAWLFGQAQAHEATIEAQKAQYAKPTKVGGKKTGLDEDEPTLDSKYDRGFGAGGKQNKKKNVRNNADDEKEAKQRKIDELKTKVQPGKSDAEKQESKLLKAFKDKDVNMDPIGLKEVDTTREPCSMVFIGHVDAGKSTICGNLMYLMGVVDQRTIDKYKQEAKDKGRDSWWLAYVMDVSDDEKAKGKTVEVGRAQFDTKSKKYTIFDAPGHKNYVPNMIMGAAMADVGGLVISARKGEFEAGFEKDGQTREHAQLAKSLGVQKLVIIVNKMDDCKWNKARFDEIKTGLLPFLHATGYTDDDLIWVPIVGISGENIIEPVTHASSKWYTGPTLMEVLDNVGLEKRFPQGPLRIPILDKMKEKDLVIHGKVENGTIKLGDRLALMPSGAPAQVLSLLDGKGDIVKYACPGENVQIILNVADPESVKRGDVLSNRDQMMPVTEIFEAEMQILDLLDYKPIISKGYGCIMHIHTYSDEVVIKDIMRKEETNEKGEVITKQKPQFAKSQNKVIVRIAPKTPVALEKFETMQQMGRFTLRDEGKTICVGKVIKYKPYVKGIVGASTAPTGGVAAVTAQMASTTIAPKEDMIYDMETGEMRPKKKDLDGIQEGDEDDDE